MLSLLEIIIVPGKCAINALSGVQLGVGTYFVELISRQNTLLLTLVKSVLGQQAPEHFLALLLLDFFHPFSLAGRNNQDFLKQKF